MEKGMDLQTMSAETFENGRNFWIAEHFYYFRVIVFVKISFEHKLIGTYKAYKIISTVI